jgi:hypothetical protein
VLVLVLVRGVVLALLRVRTPPPAGRVGWVFSLVSAGSAQPSWWSCWSPTQNSLPCDSMQPGYEMIRGEKVSS